MDRDMGNTIERDEFVAFFCQIQPATADAAGPATSNSATPTQRITDATDSEAIKRTASRQPSKVEEHGVKRTASRQQRTNEAVNREQHAKQMPSHVAAPSKQAADPAGGMRRTPSKPDYSKAVAIVDHMAHKTIPLI